MNILVPHGVHAVYSGDTRTNDNPSLAYLVSTPMTADGVFVSFKIQISSIVLVPISLPHNPSQ